MARSRKTKRARPRPAPNEIPALVESQLARERALDALNRMRREGRSITRAAREAGTTARTVRKYVGRALTERGGRLVAKPSDGLVRRMRFLSARGRTDLTVRSSRTASRIADYWAAVDHYLKTGDPRWLRPFRGKSIRAEKLGHPFITDPKTLSRLATAGEVAFEDLYALVA